MPAILTVSVAADSVFDVIFTRALRIEPTCPGRFPIIGMYGFQPAEATARFIRQSGINHPLGTTPAPRSVSQAPENQLRNRRCQHSKACLTFLQLELAGMLRRTIAHDLDKPIAGSKRHHRARAPEPGSVLPLMPPFIFAAPGQ